MSIVKVVTTRMTTTSYALLGLLDLGPFSAYDLTKYMQRSALNHLWPRTEASIYREPKALVANGLARVHTERNGRRARTVYRITPAGRRALRAWLRKPAGTGVRFECEAAVKAFFADAADLETLRAHLEQLRDEHRVETARGEELMRDWMAGRLRFPERLQYTVLAADLIGRVGRAVDEWAEAWLASIAEWESTELHDISERQARDLLAGRPSAEMTLADAAQDPPSRFPMT